MVRGAVVVLAVVVVTACGGDDRAGFDTRTTLTALAGPATTTTDRATTTVPAAPRRGRLVVSATGDVNLDPGYIPELATEGYSYPWSGLQDLFNQDDLTVVNLECAASDLGEPEAKDFVFRCDPDALDEMAAAGVEVANLGNNHSGDYGKEALVDSVRQVEADGMAAVGAGVDSARAHRAALFDIDGWTVAVVGFGGVYPTLDWFATEDRPGMADGDTMETMVATVEAADAVADIVLVTIHWGVELDTAPRPGDRNRAERWSPPAPTPSSGTTPTDSSRWRWSTACRWLGAGQLRVADQLARGSVTTGSPRWCSGRAAGVTACLLPVAIEAARPPGAAGRLRPGPALRRLLKSAAATRPGPAPLPEIGGGDSARPCAAS